VQCEQLFTDILNAGQNKEVNAHFIGSIVYVHDGVYSASGLTELTIIDGQQRLTTITLIYIAIYRLAQELNNKMLANKINKIYLINEFAEDSEKLKLRPTDNNDKALKFILTADKNDEYSNGYSRIIENYRFFKNKITSDNLECVQEGLSKLIFIDISLDRQKDNPQRIFESLNSTGLELSPADLIRNYILMGLNQDDQKKIYKKYWNVIEQQAKDEELNKSKVSDFIRDFLTLKNKEIPNKASVYFEFKRRFPTTNLDNLTTILEELKSIVYGYNKLLNPKNEQDKEIRTQLEYINKLEINVAYPFLIQVYEDYTKTIIDKPTFIAILSLIQSFTWRRFIVGLQTNALNKIFMSLYDKVDRANYLESVQKALLKLSGSQVFPRDKEVVSALKIKDIYNIKSKNRSYLLERLENFDNREPVVIDGNTDITVEHIFPRNPDSKWLDTLTDEEYKFILDTYLNTIGNITLSGNNGKLSNKPFLEKRDLPDFGYKDSRLWLNRYLANAEKWDKSEIEKRAKKIADRFLKIWQIPSIHISETVEYNDVNIFDAENPTYKKLEYALFLGKKVEVREVANLYVEIFRQIFELYEEDFMTTDLAKKLTITKNKNDKNIRIARNLNDNYYIETGYSNVDKFNKIKSILTHFDLEDELFIKYAPIDTIL
jgi:uncharacterized protein with ParB-like and HNH nuclease domain